MQRKGSVYDKDIIILVLSLEIGEENLSVAIYLKGRGDGISSHMKTGKPSYQSRYNQAQWIFHYSKK